MTSKLTAEGRADLARLEKIVRDGLENAVAVCNALLEIHERKLYKEHCSTFESYVQVRFGLTRSHAYRQIEIARTVGLLSPVGDSQVITPNAIRPLIELPREERADAFAEAAREAEAEGSDKVTQKHTQAAADRRTKRTPAQEARARQRRAAKSTRPPEAQSGAEQGAPEVKGGASTVTRHEAKADDCRDPEVRTDAPAPASSENPESENPDTTPALDAASDPQHAPEGAEPGTLVGDNDSPGVLKSTAAVVEGGVPRQLTRDEQLAIARELAREANPNARLPRRPPIPRLMEFVRVAVDLEEPSADEVDAIPTNDLMLEHLERAHRIIGLILTRNGRSAAA